MRYLGEQKELIFGSRIKSEALLQKLLFYLVILSFSCEKERWGVETVRTKHKKIILSSYKI